MSIVVQVLPSFFSPPSSPAADVVGLLTRSFSFAGVVVRVDMSDGLSMASIWSIASPPALSGRTIPALPSLRCPFEPYVSGLIARLGSVMAMADVLCPRAARCAARAW
jgi:hypothetical protein